MNSCYEWIQIDKKSAKRRTNERRSRWWNRYSFNFFAPSKWKEREKASSIKASSLPWATICIPFGYICYAPRNARHLSSCCRQKTASLMKNWRPRFQFRETLISLPAWHLDKRSPSEKEKQNQIQSTHVKICVIGQWLHLLIISGFERNRWCKASIKSAICWPSI